MIKLVGIAAAAGAIGFILGNRFGKRPQIVQIQPNLFKSFDNQHPLLKYVIEHSQRLHPTQEKLMEITKKHIEFDKMGAPEVVQLNMNLMKLMKAKKILDIGVYTGYSALGAALSIPDDGKIIACDIDEEAINMGRPIWKEAGVEEKIDVRIQPAINTLNQLIDSGESGTFDFAFIDADKYKIGDYYEKCLTLVRRGGLIAIDNTLWDGDVLNENSKSKETQAIRVLNKKVFNDPRVDISFLTIGDGLTLAFKR